MRLDLAKILLFGLLKLNSDWLVHGISCPHLHQTSTEDLSQGTRRCAEVLRHCLRSNRLQARQRTVDGRELLSAELDSVRRIRHRLWAGGDLF